MHAFVEKVSGLRSESLRVGLLASLRAANTIEKNEFADSIESPDTALWKLAIVSMLAKRAHCLQHGRGRQRRRAHSERHLGAAAGAAARELRRAGVDCGVIFCHFLSFFVRH